MRHHVGEPRGLPYATGRNPPNRAPALSTTSVPLFEPQSRNKLSFGSRVTGVKRLGRIPMDLYHRKSGRTDWLPTPKLFSKVAWAILILAVLTAAGSLQAQSPASQIQDITGNYDFLKPYNTLAILQEDQMLKGYIDVLQGESASDAVFSYNLTIGERKGNHIEFRTSVIHEKYYRFSGTVQRGKGKEKGDPDYLELVGELQTIQNNSVTNQKKVDRQKVVFKSKGNNEQEP